MMNRKIKIGFFAAIALALVLEAFGTQTIYVWLDFISGAQAKVGRPLTPVSVAGVGRRTARRCAAGVYNC